jgi:hypothetical protein
MNTSRAPSYSPHSDDANAVDGSSVGSFDHREATGARISEIVERVNEEMN